MGSDRARVSFDPSRYWRGLVAQQGRVSVEADWNEATAIDLERDRLVTLDVVGPLGTPDGGYVVTAVAPSAGLSPPAGSPGALSVGPGTLYLGGLRLELDEAVTIDDNTQPDWLDASTDTLFVAPEPAPQSPPSSPTAASNDLVYLLAIEQEVSALEVPELADVALGGPDTMQRLRFLQRFVVWPTSSTDCASAWQEVQTAWNTIGLTLDPSTMQLESMANLLVSFDPTPPSTSPCEPSATGGYLGPENQLVRVQVASVDPSSGLPTVVWGFDDATFLYSLQSAIPTSTGNLQVTFNTNPVDSYHYPVTGQAVELLRDAAELSVPVPPSGSPPSSQTTYDYLASPSGFVSAVVTSYSPTQMTLTLTGQPPADYLSTAATPQLYLRVWQATAVASPGSSVELSGAGAVTGVQVTLGSSGAFHAGDFWRFALRPSVPQLVYPARIAASAQPPDGPRVWACPIAFVDWAAGATPTISSCVPGFDNLVELTGRLGGCCTLEITPGSLSGGATLGSLLAPYAGLGPVNLCLGAGTYTLEEPLVIDGQFDGITISGCSAGVVLEAASSSADQLVLGLIELVEVRQVRLSNLTFSLPLGSLQPGAGAFDGLASAGVSETNRVLLDQISRDLQVGFGVAVSNAVGLTIENCTFSLDLGDSTSNVLAAGIFASGEVVRLSVTDCVFDVEPQPTTVPFYNLSVGNETEPPYQLTFGYLQSTTLSGDDDVLTLLHEASISRCLFGGLSVAVLAMARLGNVALSDNTVQDCYGGLWLAALATSERAFDILPVGDEAARVDLVKLGLTALADPSFVVASAIVRVLPQLSASPNLVPRIIEVASGAEMQVAVSSWQSFIEQAASAQTSTSPTPASSPPASGTAPHAENITTTGDTGGVSPGAGAPAPTEASPVPGQLGITPEQAGEVHAVEPDIPHLYPGLNEVLRAVGTEPPSVPEATDTGVIVSLRADIHHNQVDAIVEDSYSAAGLVVVDLTGSGTPGSVLVHANRIRNRFPEGETALLGGVGATAVSGNIIENDVAVADDNATEDEVSYSLVLLPGKVSLAGIPVAVVGNVLIDTAILPARVTGLPAWSTLNAELNY